MSFRYVSIAALVLLCATLQAADEKGTHLFILSGQSNMARFTPDETFTPAVEKQFGKENVVVVKDAKGGQPIRRWYKDWKDAKGEAPKSTGDLYDVLMKKVKEAIEGKTLRSVTFIWMQGERDAKEKHGEVYADSLKGLIEQVKADLGLKKLHVIIGRLSDFDMENAKYPHWTMIREAQADVVKSLPSAALIDTDDLNDGKNAQGKELKNDLHYTPDGYKALGTRYAEKAIELIDGSKKK